MIIVDEPAAPNVETSVLPVLDLARIDRVKGSALSSKRLGFLRRRILDGLAELPDGPLPPSAAAAGATWPGCG